MNTSNSPLTEKNESNVSSKNYKNVIIGGLSVLLVSLGGYLFYNNSKHVSQIQQDELKVSGIIEEKSNLQSSFDASLSRLDSMTTVTTGLHAELAEKSSEIAKTKEEIRKILNNKNSTSKELERAKSLIAGLNEKISGMEADIARLTEENQLLTQDKIALTEEKSRLTDDLTATKIVKKELEKKVDVASTLNASNILITSLDVRRNGKEKTSTKAKRVDKLVVSFDVANRIIQPGTADVFVIVIGPDGKAVSTGDSGLFNTREDGDKSYTAKLPVDLETSTSKNVHFSFTPGNAFQKGNYKIQIYQNGFLIGEGSKELKKSGLFG